MAQRILVHGIPLSKGKVQVKREFMCVTAGVDHIERYDLREGSWYIYYISPHCCMRAAKVLAEEDGLWVFKLTIVPVEEPVGMEPEFQLTG